MRETVNKFPKRMNHFPERRIAHNEAILQATSSPIKRNPRTARNYVGQNIKIVTGNVSLKRSPELKFVERRA